MRRSGGLGSKLDGCDEKDKPDIQVLSSCGADKTIWAAKEDGYLLCSDGCGQEVYAITHTKGRNRTETISPSFPTEVPYLFVYKTASHCMRVRRINGSGSENSKNGKKA